MIGSLAFQKGKPQCHLMTLPLPKLLLTGLMARTSMARHSKYRLPPGELSLPNEEVGEVHVEVVLELEVEVSEVVVAVDPTLTLKEGTGLVPTALVAT